MTRTLVLTALAVTAASCTPQGDDLTSQAIAACKRADVQDVVGKEARNMMLKANQDGVWKAAFFGVNLVEAFERARTSFGEVGVYKESATSPYTQIVCAGSMQIDGSSAQAGQDIVTIPHLRWSINFAEPTQEPETASFSIAVDPASVFEGVLFNGQEADHEIENSALPAVEKADGQVSAEGTASLEESQIGSAEDAAAANAEALADAEKAKRAGDDVEEAKQPSSDEDLYAPHSN